ncbi:MAG TPA: ketopantoate reductase family protein [Aquifex aeolicus]|nr:ketopantoate reductase family protein [Aquificales bacterium]HIQ25943.1 ketopantoate reductase family protein [Aquifex aeolicus]
MRILIFGLGAIGGIFAGFLKKAGNEVYAIGRRRIISTVREKGLKIVGIWGEHKVNLNGVYKSVDELPLREFDLVILTVKSYDTTEALNHLMGLRFKYLLLAQNGYGNYEKAKEFFPSEKLILAMVIFGARITPKVEFEVTVCGDDVVIGNPDGAIEEKTLKEIAQTVNSAGIPTRYSSDVYKYLWDKILYNCALNPLGALLETNYGTLAGMEETKILMGQIIEEIFKVAKAKGIELFWKNPEEYRRFFFEKLIPPTADHYPSMLWDVKSGKRTEIDALNGAIVGLGKEVGVSTPINEVITKLVKAKEKLRLKA